MATSLQTANYGFGKYAPNDMTSYLTDYNGTMDKIDGAIKGVSDVANEAKATGDSNLNNIASLSQGLTAANKNVENLGKTQTAQQVEIDALNENFDSIVIGSILNPHTMTGNSGITGAETPKLNARTIGNSLVGGGGLRTKDDAKTTMQASKIVSGGRDLNVGGKPFTMYCYELFRVSGNPFELSEGIKYGILDVFESSNNSAINFSLRNRQALAYEYDASSGFTRFYLTSVEQTYTPTSARMYYLLNF